MLKAVRLQPKIVLIYVDSGGGHRAAATALTEVIRRQERPWDVSMVGSQGVLDPIDYIRRYTGIAFQDVYNIMLRRGWTLGSKPLIRMMHRVIRASHGQQVEEFRKFWTRERPDLVVSLIPHFNRAVKEGLDLAQPGTPFVTLPTDLADYPPNFWIERMHQWVICGSDRAARQAREVGIPDGRVLRASGMILNPRFYDPMVMERARERERLGLRPDVPTGLVLFGGEGSKEIVPIAKRLERFDAPLQLILICGRHRQAAARLHAMQPRIPMHVEGFTREIPYYMELADFFIGKPGPGSISEALHKRLPVIVQSNAWTMAHERYNAQWVAELGAGIVVRNFDREILGAVQSLLAPERFREFRARAAAYTNRAVYEIPEMLAQILSQRAQHIGRPRLTAV